MLLSTTQPILTILSENISAIAFLYQLNFAGMTGGRVQHLVKGYFLDAHQDHTDETHRTTIHTHRLEGKVEKYQLIYYASL